MERKVHWGAERQVGSRGRQGREQTGLPAEWRGRYMREQREAVRE